MITEEITDSGPRRPFEVLGTTLIISEIGAGAPRCPGAACANQPTTMRLQYTISGTFPTSAECNSEVDYPLDVSGDSGVVNVRDQDGPDCSIYSVEAPPFSFSSDCEAPECNETFDILVSAILGCSSDDGHWFLTFIVDGANPICHPSLDPWGGIPIFDPGIDIGTNPVGTHHLTFDDPNHSTIHYDITMTIT